MMTSNSPYAGLTGAALDVGIKTGKLYATAVDEAQVVDFAANKNVQTAITEQTSSYLADKTSEAAEFALIKVTLKFVHNPYAAAAVILMGTAANVFELKDYLKAKYTAVEDSYMQNLQNQQVQFQVNLHAALDPLLTTQQSLDLAQYDQAVSNSDFAGMIAATSQMAQDLDLVGTTSSNGSITYQQDGLSATVSAIWQPLSLTSENTDATSQVTNYSADGSSIMTTYTGPGGTGTAVGIDRENYAGTSQITTISTADSTTEYYTGPNGTGEITEKDQENSGGSSVITNYNVDGSSTAISYSGANGSGDVTQTSVTNSDNSYRITIYDPSYTITENFDTSGQQTGNVVDVNSGAGVVVNRSSSPDFPQDFYLAGAPSRVVVQGATTGALNLHVGTTDFSYIEFIAGASVAVTMGGRQGVVGRPNLGYFTSISVSWTDGIGGAETAVFPEGAVGYLSSSQGLPGSSDFVFGVASSAGYEVACFCAGTHIMTSHGTIPIEDLTVGDMILTHSGSTVPALWIGCRHIECKGHPKPCDVWPVHVHPGAFGPALPNRDLWLSPDHAVFIDGVLIPIRYLLNGATIVQEPKDAVSYWHVELADHDLLLAEGMPCESYLDTGNRSMFSNGGPSARLHRGAALKVWESSACARLVLEGAALEAARSFVLDRAIELGHRMTSNADLRLVADGHVLRPEIRGCVHRFQIPENASTLRLISRNAVAAHLHDNVTDHRRLGVAVSCITCSGMEIPLDDPSLGYGWHDVERHADGLVWRWSCGETILSVPRGQVLDVDVAMTARYWLRHEDSEMIGTDHATAA